MTNSHTPPIHVNISSITLIKVVLVALALVLLWAIREIIIMILIAWVLSMALHPWVDRLQRWHIPRALGILSVYAGAAVVASVVIILLVPPVTNELSSIAANFPDYYEPINASLANIRATGESFGLSSAFQNAMNNAINGVAELTNGIYSTVSSVLSGVITLVGILVIAFYMTIEQEGIRKFAQSLSPISYQPYVMHKINQIQRRLSGWLGGQLILMLFVGTLVGVSLWLIGVPYSLVLGILAGILEFIPIVGPTMAAIPAIFFAFTDFADAPYKPFVVLAVFIVIQQIENQLLVPRIMKRAVGLNPIIIIIALLIGAKLGGFVGVVLSIPFVAIIDVFLADFIEQKQQEQNRLEN